MEKLFTIKGVVIGPVPHTTTDFVPFFYAGDAEQPSEIQQRRVQYEIIREIINIRILTRKNFLKALIEVYGVNFDRKKLF
jgi:hypothetical protein